MHFSGDFIYDEGKWFCVKRTQKHLTCIKGVNISWPQNLCIMPLIFYYEDDSFRFRITSVLAQFVQFLYFNNKKLCWTETYRRTYLINKIIKRN